MAVGKWHVGDSAQTLPTAQGFDRYFGIPYSNDMARKKGWGNDPADLDRIWIQKKWDVYDGELYRDDKVVESPVNQTTPGSSSGPVAERSPDNEVNRMVISG